MMLKNKSKRQYYRTIQTIVPNEVRVLLSKMAKKKKVSDSSFLRLMITKELIVEYGGKKVKEAFLSKAIHQDTFPVDEPDLNEKKVREEYDKKSKRLKDELY